MMEKLKNEKPELTEIKKMFPDIETFIKEGEKVNHRYLWPIFEYLAQEILELKQSIK